MSIKFKNYYYYDAILTEQCALDGQLMYKNLETGNYDPMSDANGDFFFATGI